MKNLIMMVGLPRSGKSTIAKTLGHPIVNPDSIRLVLHGQRFCGVAEPMVWAIAKYMVAALFEAGHNFVILDATNTTGKRREEWVDKRWIRTFYPVLTSVDVCKERAIATNDDYILPIIEKMDSQFEHTMDEEVRVWEEEPYCDSKEQEL